MSPCFKGYLHTGWKIVAILSFLVLLATIAIILIFNTKMIPAKSYTKVLWFSFFTCGLTMIDSIGVKIMRNLVIVPVSIWVAVGLLNGFNPAIFWIGCLVLTIISFSCSIIYKHYKGIPA